MWIGRYEPFVKYSTLMCKEPSVWSSLKQCWLCCIWWWHVSIFSSSIICNYSPPPRNFYYCIINSYFLYYSNSTHCVAYACSESCRHSDMMRAVCMSVQICMCGVISMWWRFSSLSRTCFSLAALCWGMKFSLVKNKNITSFDDSIS